MWVLVITAEWPPSNRLGGSHSHAATIVNVLSKNIKNIKFFPMKFSIFTAEKKNHSILFEQAFIMTFIIGQIGYCIGGNFNIHIWAWSASPSVQVGRL